MTFRSASSRRVVIAFAIALFPAGVLVPIGCSSPESHPPVIGDCSGALCPPAQGQGVSGSTGGSSGSEGGTGAETGSGDGGGGGDSATSSDTGTLGD